MLSACCSTPATPSLDFLSSRRGLHHGPVVDRSGDLFGATVNLAARVAGQASGGQILATAVIAEAARDRGLRAVELGSFELRNVPEPVSLHEVDTGAVPHGAVIDPVCRMVLLFALGAFVDEVKDETEGPGTVRIGSDRGAEEQRKIEARPYSPAPGTTRRADQSIMLAERESGAETPPPGEPAPAPPAATRSRAARRRNSRRVTAGSR